MAVTLTTFESNLQTKLNNTTGTTDGQEFLLLSKSVEALNPSIAVSDVQAEGTAQVAVVNAAGATQVAAVQAAGSGYAALAGATFTGAIDMGSNNITTTGKVLYANMYATPADLPSASTYHGLFAHTHSNGRAVFSHNNNWYNLLHEDTSGNVNLGGDLTVTGSLIVNGTTTTLNSATLDVDDLNITVASGAADAATANGGGITVDGANATFNYASSGDKWTMNKPLDVTGAVTSSGVNLGDNAKAQFGASNDLQIYHDTNHSLIQESGTGALKIKGDDIRIEDASGNNIIKAVGNGSAELYESGSKKLETTSTGVDVTGSLGLSGQLNAHTEISKFSTIRERAWTDTGTGGTTNIQMRDGTAIVYFINNQTQNAQVNFIGDGSTTLDALLSVNDSVTAALIYTQGSTAYYLNQIQVDGTTANVTTKWVGGAPTGGNTNSIDAYTITIIKTASGTFTCLANQTAYE